MEGSKLARQDLEIEMGAVVGFIWRDWKKNNKLNGELSKVTLVLKVRRLKSTGHTWKRKQELVFQILIC